MQFSNKIELVGLSALSSDPLAEPKWASAVGQDHASRLHLAVLAESLEQMGFCIVERVVADHRHFRHVGSVHTPTVSEDGTWYSNWLNDIQRSFNNLFLLRHSPNKPEYVDLHTICGLIYAIVS